MVLHPRASSPSLRSRRPHLVVRWHDDVPPRADVPKWTARDHRASRSTATNLVEPGGQWLCPTSCLTGLQLRHLVVEAPAVPDQGAWDQIDAGGSLRGAVAADARAGEPDGQSGGCRWPRRRRAGVAVSRGWGRRELCRSGSGVDRGKAGRLVPARSGNRLDAGRDSAAARRRARSSACRNSPVGRRPGWCRRSPHRWASVRSNTRRVMRFSRALQQIHAASGTLSDVAADAGYYDQPHMNSEFKELSGFTPRRIPELAPLSQQRQRRRNLVRPFFQDARLRPIR